MTGLKSIPTKSSSIVAKKTGNEYILVPVTENIADMNSLYTLNETGAFIWEHIDGEKSIEDIIDHLINEYDTDYHTAENDVLSFIEEMSRYLIVNE
jgi:hypothetical protein